MNLPVIGIDTPIWLLHPKTRNYELPRTVSYGDFYVDRLDIQYWEYQYAVKLNCDQFVRMMSTTRGQWRDELQSTSVSLSLGVILKMANTWSLERKNKEQLFLFADLADATMFKLRWA